MSNTTMIHLYSFDDPNKVEASVSIPTIALSKLDAITYGSAVYLYHQRNDKYIRARSIHFDMDENYLVFPEYMDVDKMMEAKKEKIEKYLRVSKREGRLQ